MVMQAIEAKRLADSANSNMIAKTIFETYKC